MAVILNNHCLDGCINYVAFCILTKNNNIPLNFLSASKGVITGVVVSGSNITVSVQATGAKWFVVIMRSASFDRWQQTGELWYNYICVEWVSSAFVTIDSVTI